MNKTKITDLINELPEEAREPFTMLVAFMEEAGIDSRSLYANSAMNALIQAHPQLTPEQAATKAAAYADALILALNPVEESEAEEIEE